MLHARVVDYFNPGRRSGVNLSQMVVTEFLTRYSLSTHRRLGLFVAIESIVISGFFSGRLVLTTYDTCVIFRRLLGCRRPAVERTVN